MRSEAYWEGYKAYQDGKSVDDNPYSTSVKEEQLWEEWKEGYYDAGWDD